MTELALTVTAGALILAVPAVLVLFLRRAALAREDRKRERIEAEMAPLAVEIAGGAEPPDDLSRDQARALATILGRYGRVLRGPERARITEFFVRQGHVAGEIRALRSRRAWRRALAARLLGDMGSEAAVEPLVAALADRDRDVKVAAARSLGLLSPDGAVAPIVAALADGRLPSQVGGAALLAMGTVPAESILPLFDSPDPEVQTLGIELFGRLAGPTGARRLESLLDADAPDVRARAARLLGRIGDSESARLLRRKLEDRNPAVRAAAAVGLGGIGDRAAAEDLVRIAQTDQFNPARYAARALQRIAPELLRERAKQVGAGPHLIEAADRLEAGV